jgi:MFS family permease
VTGSGAKAGLGSGIGLHENATPSGSRVGRMFFGWKVAIASAIILGLQSSLILQAFGNYAVVLQDRFGWSKTTISVAYSFNRAESGLLGPLHGWMLQRFGNKRVMQVGAVIIVIGFVWFSQISSPLWFIVSFFVIAVGAGLSGFMTVNTEVVHWFARHRAKALSLTGLGIAAGGLFAPLIVVALTQLGWRATAVLSGLLLGSVTLALSQMFGSSPAKRGLPLDGIENPSPAIGRQAASLSAVHLTARQAVRTSAFWYLAIGHAAALLVVGSVIAHLSLYLTEEQGYTLQGASFVLAGITVTQIIGMAVGGVLGDRLDKRWLSAGAMFGHVAGLLMLTFATSALMVWGFVVLHGLAWGMRGPLMSALRADYFGSTAFAQIMGYTSLILMFGMVGGPLLAGILADVTGSYQTGFTILAVLAASGSAMFALAKPPAQPVSQPSAASPFS